MSAISLDKSQLLFKILKIRIKKITSWMQLWPMENDNLTQNSLSSTVEKKRSLTGAYPTNKECDFLPGIHRHLGIVLHDLKIGWTCGKDHEILSLPDAERQNLRASEAEKSPHLICRQQFWLSFLSKESGKLRLVLKRVWHEAGLGNKKPCGWIGHVLGVDRPLQVSVCENTECPFGMSTHVPVHTKPHRGVATLD